MQILKGKIEKKVMKSGVSKAGKKWTRTSLLVEGGWFNTFDPVEYDEGDLVAISYELQGTFKNIKSIMPWDGEDYVMEDIDDSVGEKSPLKEKKEVCKVILGHVSAKELLEMIKSFEQDHEVFATQYQMAYDAKQQCMCHSVMLFYRE